MQGQADPLVFVQQRRIQDRFADGTGNGIGDRERGDLVAEVVEHPHRVAQQRLRIQVGVGLRLDCAVRRHEIAQIERKRRRAIATRRRRVGNRLVLQLRVLDDMQEIDVDARAIDDAGHRHVGRRKCHRRGDDHAIEQQRAKRAADPSNGGIVGHG